MLPIIIGSVPAVVSDPKRNKKPLEYLKMIFLWFTIPYNGWKVINGGDKNIVEDHWFMKVMNK